MLKELIGRRRRFTIWISAVVAVVLIVTAFTGLLPQGTLQAEAAVTTGTEGHVADTDTSQTMTLGNASSTRYSGRVWVDKTVSTGNVNYGEFGITNDSDFLVTYSALATSTKVQGGSPVDVVFVLDISASMCWGVQSQLVTSKDDSRIKAMVDALNASIDQLVKANDNNRIGIAVFNGTGSVLMELTDAETIKNNVKAGNYITLQSFSGTEGMDNGNATILCNMNNATAVTAGGTNIQAGLFQGMNLLATENETTFRYDDGETVTRIPNVILMSDGAPTTFASAQDTRQGNNNLGIVDNKTDNINDNEPIESGTWWNLNEGDESKRAEIRGIGGGDNYRAHSADGFMALATASFMKNKISANYYGQDGGKSDENTANVYTIGFSTEYQTDTMKTLASVVLNPGQNLNASLDGFNSGSPSDKELQTLWSQYQSYISGNNAEVYGHIGSTGNNGDVPSKGDSDFDVENADKAGGRYPNWDWNDMQLRGYVVEHPTGEDKWYDPMTFDYPTEYFSANDTAGLVDIFEQIAGMITSEAEGPTKVTGEDPVHDGYITYTDRTGRYMEIKNVKTLIWSGQRFDNPVQGMDSDGNTTYTFSGSIDSEVYGRHDVSEIQITVKKSEADTQTIEVKIPASAIPLRVNTITLSADETVSSNESNNAMPFRLCYEVGLSVNAETLVGVDPDYIEANKADNGGAYFYSNYYQAADQETGTAEQIGAKVEFTPADSNPFYYVQEDTLLYTDKNLTIPATGPINPDSDYYFQITYYEGKETKTAVVTRPGSLLNGHTNEIGGQQYLKAGAPRLGYLTDFVSNKVGNGTVGANPTGTAATYFEPTFPENGTPGKTPFTVYLGNNGCLQTEPIDTSLTVSKRVTTSQQGVIAPDEEFTFNLTIEDMKGKTVQATVTSGAAGTSETKEIVFNETTGVAQFMLKKDQTITIPDLPIGENYTLEETDLPDGFTVTDPTGGRAERTLLETAENNAVTFENVYTPEGSITITKRDGSGNLLEGAGFTLYDSNGDVVKVTADGVADENGTADKLMVYLACRTPIQSDDLNYDPVRNRYTASDGSQYIVHRTVGTDDLFYYRKLTEEEAGNYRQNPSGYDKIEAVVEFSGLPLGTYTFKETEVPESYMAANDQSVNLETPGVSYYDVLYTVENHKGLVLPTTGLNGIGFIVAAGAILAAGGGGYFFFRRLAPAGSRRRRHHR